MTDPSPDRDQDDCDLLAADEPPPVTLINPDGRRPVLLVADHASNRIPRVLDDLGLEPWVLERHVAYDIGAKPLVEHLARLLDAPALLAGYSRLVIDLNRALSDATAMPECSDGIPIPGNVGMDAAQRRQRVHCIYTPYRRAIDSELERMTDGERVPALIAIHSFTPVMDGHPRPWQVGIMWDKDPRIPVPLMHNLRTHDPAVMVGDNLPYSGRHAADYTIDHHAEATGIAHVSIELRQDLVGDEPGALRWAGILHDALDGLLAEPRLYRRWDRG